jgi:hypothetical protein
MDWDLELDGRPVKEILLQNCHRDITMLENFVNMWTLDNYSTMFLDGIWHALLLTVRLLDDPIAKGIFMRACFLLTKASSDFPVVIYMLQALPALAWRFKQQVPELALECISKLAVPPAKLQDVPLDFAIPSYDHTRRVLLTGEQVAANDMNSIGDLLSRWVKLSL